MVHPGQRSLRIIDLQPWHSDLTNSLANWSNFLIYLNACMFIAFPFLYYLVTCLIPTYVFFYFILFYTYLHFRLLESRKKAIDQNRVAQNFSLRFVLVISFYLVLGPARYFVPSDLQRYSFVLYLLRGSPSVRQVPK